MEGVKIIYPTRKYRDGTGSESFLLDRSKPKRIIRPEIPLMTVLVVGGKNSPSLLSKIFYGLLGKSLSRKESVGCILLTMSSELEGSGPFLFKSLQRSPSDMALVTEWCANSAMQGTVLVSITPLLLLFIEAEHMFLFGIILVNSQYVARRCSAFRTLMRTDAFILRKIRMHVRIVIHL